MEFHGNALAVTEFTNADQIFFTLFAFDLFSRIRQFERFIMERVISEFHKIHFITFNTISHSVLGSFQTIFFTCAFFLVNILLFVFFFISPLISHFLSANPQKQLLGALSSGSTESATSHKKRPGARV